MRGHSPGTVLLCLSVSLLLSSGADAVDPVDTDVADLACVVESVVLGSEVAIDGLALDAAPAKLIRSAGARLGKAVVVLRARGACRSLRPASRMVSGAAKRLGAAWRASGGDPDLEPVLDRWGEMIFEMQQTVAESALALAEGQFETAPSRRHERKAAKARAALDEATALIAPPGAGDVPFVWSEGSPRAFKLMARAHRHVASVCGYLDRHYGE